LLYKNYILTFVLLVLAVIFSSPLPFVLQVPSLFSYSKKVKKIGLVKLSVKNLPRNLKLESNEISIYFDVLGFVCALIGLLGSVFLLIVNPNKWLIAVLGIIFSGSITVFFIYLFILRYKKKR